MYRRDRKCLARGRGIVPDASGLEEVSEERGGDCRADDDSIDDDDDGGDCSEDKDGLGYEEE